MCVRGRHAVRARAIIPSNKTTNKVADTNITNSINSSDSSICSSGGSNSIIVKDTRREHNQVQYYLI